MQENESTVQGTFKPAGGVDLLLIYPPWASLGSRGILQNSLPPLGILSIASYAEQQGFRVQVLDVHAERLDDREVTARIVAASPRIVGISVLTNMAVPAHCIARLAKQAVPACKVIVGGVHAEALPEETLRNSAIDAVCRGDGEETTVDVLRNLPFSEIKGLSYRIGNRVAHNPPRPVEKDLDKYPFPAYHLIDFKRYFPSVGSYRRLPAINMLMTRGCIGNCTFCNSARTVLRSRSAASVVEQIKVLRYQYGIRQIQFYDDTFTAMKKNVMEFCRLIVEQKVDVTWTAYIRGDCFSDEMAVAMKSAGCHQVLMGVETGDERLMESIRKPIDKAKYKEAVRIAHRHGMEVRASFILGHIGETRESLQATLDLAKELDIDLMQLAILTPLPGTWIFKEAVEKNLLIHRNWNEYGADKVLMNLPTITAQEILEFERHAFRSFYLRPKSIVRHLRRVVSPRQIRDLAAAFMMFILGTTLYKNPKWDCWNKWQEKDFQDLDIELPKKPRLTHELRQNPIFL